eukprot:CAMPEP_0115592644 /NCGR_PEP_ID=MMETSP0272-20121206/10891_1 /TAXON_ID=71861 /ORGANISM="Scrippsiella trochoidea, Strain CCMP3099" /LENGTH=275 /DNA_ID=CAMNT_0003027887 /DNA_START=89 /DNA_END=912 /DNA_ORIENTATION=-
MTHYECCYSSGRQFVFTEQRRWVFAGLAAVALCGLVVGLSIGVTISLAGVCLFEFLMVGFACCAAHQAYTSMFQRVSSSVDFWSYVVGNAASLALLGLLLRVTRLSMREELGLMSRSALFSFGGVFLSVVYYVYVRLCLQEDERKHHLGLCTPDGQALDQPLSPIAAAAAAAAAESKGGGLSDACAGGGDDEEEPSTLDVALRRLFGEDFVRFLLWILSWRWWVDLNCLDADRASGDEECATADAVVFHNRTLKLVKVCFYSSDDLLCWVPLGGV